MRTFEIEYATRTPNDRHRSSCEMLRDRKKSSLTDIGQKWHREVDWGLSTAPGRDSRYSPRYASHVSGSGTRIETVSTPAHETGMECSKAPSIARM